MNVHSRLAPIDALAAHFRASRSGSIKKHATLGVPSFLRASLDEKLDPPAGETRASFTTKEVKILIESISEEDFERWCLLDTAAFIFVTKVLLGATSCLAKDQGLFRLIEALETWNDENNELAMSKEQLVGYKDIVGESLAVDLLVYFTEREEPEFSRRWAGLLLVELLEDSRTNRQRVWKMPEETFQDIGEVITSGADRMLKIVAGKIIWQMIQNFGDEVGIRDRLSAFCQSDDGGFTKEFPLQNGSQWENGFANFITNMEEDRYSLDIGLPTGYNAYQVKLGSKNCINSEIGAMSIGIAEIFSIYIPPNRDHSPDWVDFKIVNISRVEFTSQGVNGDAMKDLTYFKLYLCDYEEDGYLYLLSMRPSSDSDNVMILCDKTDAEDFAEDVERYRDEVLKRKSNRVLTSSAPVKDIQANPEHYQSQQEKLKELQRHRDDILKVLESPAKSNVSSTAGTDTSGDGDALGFQTGKERLEKPREEVIAGLDLIEEEDEINYHSPGNFNPDLVPSSMISRQQSLSSPVADKPVQKPIEVPDIVLDKVGGTSGSGLSIYHFAGDSLDKTSKTASQSSPAHLRSSIRVQQTAQNFNVSIDSESELSDLTGIPDETELEFLFRGATVEKKASGKLAGSRVKLKEKPEVFGSKAARRLDFLDKADPMAVELGYKLKRTETRSPVPTAAVEPSGVLVESPSSRSREIIVMKNHLESKGTPRQRPQPAITDTLGVSGALGRPLETVGSVGAAERAKRSPNHAVRNFLDGVSIMKTRGQSKADLGRDDQPANPSAIGSSDVPTTKSRLVVPSKSVARDARVNRRHMESADTPTKMPQSVVPKGVGQMDDLPMMESYVASKDGPKKKPRPAVRTIAGFLDDVLTPPGTSQKGKLKERLVGGQPKSEKRAINVQTANTKSNPTLRSHKKVVDPEKPKLVSPEDTSIWELPESEHSEKEKKLPPKRKGKAEPKKQPPPSKAKQLSKKRAYGKKPVTNPKLQSNEPISDSNGMKSVEENLFHVKAPIPKPRQNIAPKSAPAKCVVVQNSDGGKFSTRGSKSKAVQKLAPVPVSAKDLAGASDKNINATEGYKLPGFSSGMDLKPNPKSKSMSKFASPALVRHTIFDDSEYDDNSGEEKTLPARSPAKVITARGVGSRSRHKDSPEQESAGSEANTDSSWRPKTRLQAKMELVAKFADWKGVTAVGNKNSIQEGVRGTESSEESQSEYGDIGYPAVNSRKTPGISGNRGVPSAEIRGYGKVKRSPSLNSEIIVKSPTNIHERGVGARGAESLIDGRLYSPERSIPEIPAQPSTRNRKERGERRGVTGNNADSKYERIVVVLSESGSDLELELVNATGPITPANAPKNCDGIFKPITGQLKDKRQLYSDAEMPDSPAIEDKLQDVLNKPVKDDRKQNISLAAKLVRSPASTAMADVNVNNSRSLFGKELSPATPRRLDRTPRTPLPPLVDDRLARKAQIISWNSEGPKNQGRMPVMDQSLENPETPPNQENLTDSEDLLESGRVLSLYVLASEDEDRIVRRKSLFTACTTRKYTGTRVDKNGSPWLATNRENIDSMKPLQIHDSLEDGEDQNDDSAMSDIVDDAVRDNQKSRMGSEQEGEWHPASIKKLREARRVCLRDAGNANPDLKMRVISDDEDQAYPIASPPEGMGVFFEGISAGGEPLQVPHGEQANRKISIIEIFESDTEGTDGTTQVGIPEGSVTEHQIHERISSRSKLAAEKFHNVINPPPPPIPRKILLTPNKRSIVRSPGFQPWPPTAREPSPATHDLLARESKNHPQTRFFNWLQEIGFNKVNDGNRNGRNSHRGLDRKLQSVDPDKTLVNAGDFGESEIGQGLSGNSWGELDRGQRRQRDPWRSDSDDSSDFSVDNNEDSDSDEEGDEGEAPLEAREDSQLDWRRSLPNYHRETLTVLDRISEGLLRYLMSGEELAMEVIKDFEKQGNEIVRQLGESHKKEYDKFLVRVNIGKEKVHKKHTMVMEVLGHDMIELQEKQLTLAGLRKDINDDYSALDDTISKLIAQLEEELGGGM